MTQQEYPSVKQSKEGSVQNLFSEEQITDVLLGLRFLYHLYLEGKITLQIKIQKLILYFYKIDSSFHSMIDRQLVLFRKTNGLPLKGPIVLDFCAQTKIKRNGEISAEENKKAKDIERRIFETLMKS